MKRVAITLTLECRDDVPEEVLQWMAANLVQHAERELTEDYEPDWHHYQGPPLAGRISVLVNSASS